MPALARDFTVIAVDQRGIGLSDKPDGRVRHRPLANDLIALMDALGHERFAVVGHDTGFVISYALAADHPDRVDASPSPRSPGLPARRLAAGVRPRAVNDRLWHIPFNRVERLPEQLIAGREDIFFGYEFAIQGGNGCPQSDRLLRRLVSNPESLRGSLGFYRAFDATIAQNEQRATTALAMPVLAIGGEAS